MHNIIQRWWYDDDSDDGVEDGDNDDDNDEFDDVGNTSDGGSFFN